MSAVGLRTRLAELTGAGLVEHGSMTPRPVDDALPAYGQPGTRERRAYSAAYMRKRRGSRTSRSVYRLTRIGLSYIEPLGLLGALTGNGGPVVEADIISLDPETLIARAFAAPAAPALGSVADAARILGVSASTVRTLADAGTLKSLARGIGRHRRIDLEHCQLVRNARDAFCLVSEGAQLVEDLNVAEDRHLGKGEVDVAHFAEDMPETGLVVARTVEAAPSQVSEVVAAGPAQPSFDVMAAALDFRPQLLSRARVLYNGSLPEAQDAVGDVFVKLCSKPPEARTLAQLHHWLRTVLQRQWIDRHRKLTHRLVLVEKVVSLDVLNGWVG